MQIFTRQVRLLGAAQAAAWAIEVTEKATQVGGVPITLWVGRAGTPAGSFAWSARIDGLAQMIEADEKMQADPGFNDLVARGREFIADVMPDRLLQVIHSEPTTPTSVGEFMTGVTAVAQQGKGAAAGAWAVTIADAWSEITGVPCSVTTTVAGAMFEYSWMARFESATAVDEANAKLLASPDWGTEVDAGGDLFQPGATQLYAQRIA